MKQNKNKMTINKIKMFILMIIMSGEEKKVE